MIVPKSYQILTIDYGGMLEGRQQDHREVELRSWGKKYTMPPRAELFESLGINFR